MPKQKWEELNNWEKELHIAMEEIQPADWYYKFIKKLLSQTEQEVKERILKEVKKLKHTPFEVMITNIINNLK